MRIKDLEKIERILGSCRSKFNDKNWNLDLDISILIVQEEIINKKKISRENYQSQRRREKK